MLCSNTISQSACKCFLFSFSFFSSLFAHREKVGWVKEKGGSDAVICDTLVMNGVTWAIMFILCVGNGLLNFWGNDVWMIWWGTTLWACPSLLLFYFILFLLLFLGNNKNIINSTISWSDQFWVPKKKRVGKKNLSLSIYLWNCVWN